MSAPTLVLTLLAALTVEQVPNPRPAGGWVSDQADLIPPATERRIEERIAALERDLGVEIALVTVRGIEGTPKDFAVRLFAHWGIGKARADNGLLVLLVADQRRIEMETGYGLEPILPDGWLGVMQNEAMVPAFRAGDFAAGLEAGLARIDERLRSRGEEAREGTRAPEGAQSLLAPEESPVALMVIGGSLVVVLGLVAVFALVGRSRRRQRTCPRCQIQMRLLDEVEDDSHLDAGQRAEEKVGSVDYRVYICGQCQHSRTVARRRWFSRYSRCPACHYRTQSSESVTLREATYDFGGKVEITETCHHCPNRRTYHRYTAQLTRPSATAAASSWSAGSSSGGGGWSGGGSSSGGSSGGSFGGGHSGGGGAGSSW